MTANTNEKSVEGKPPVVWLEGVLDYFNTPFPHAQDDPRRIGFTVGTQIIGLYLAEMLLQYKLDQLAIPYGLNHNLHSLFSSLPASRRSEVESQYSQLLANGAEQAWDFQNSVDNFLEYLGGNPMNDSRYFWERNHSPGRSIIFLPNRLRDLIYALFITLHQYPLGAPLERRYDTKFHSLQDSFDQEDPAEPDESARTDKRITPDIFWLEGLLNYFNVPFPHGNDDPRKTGFDVGRRITGLYLIEMILKYAIDDLDRDFGRGHNLYSLFKKLPRPRQRSVEKRHHKLMRATTELAFDHERKVASHLEYLGDDPITDTRYFWLDRKRDVLLSARPLVTVIYAMFIELHGYPESGSIAKRFDTQFIPFEEASRNSVDVTFYSQGRSRHRANIRQRPPDSPEIPDRRNSSLSKRGTRPGAVSGGN